MSVRLFASAVLLAAAAVVVLAGTAAAQADLVVTKTDSPDPVEAGGDLTYTIVVANAATGSGTTNRARNVVLTDTLPAGATFVSASTTRGSCPAAPTGGAIACSIGQLQAGQSATVTIVVRPTSEGTLTNTASATTTDPESPTTNNADTETTTVRPAPADLRVAKTAAPSAVEGDEVSFFVDVTNDGPGTAFGVVLTDVLPTTFEFVSATPADACEEEAGVVTCALGDIPVDATVAVRIRATATTVGTWENVATADATNRDPDPTDNEDAATVTVTAQPADLGVTKEASQDPAWVGSPVTFWVNVTNAGPGDAHDVTVVDFPPFFATLDGLPAGCEVDPLGFLVCDLGTLDPGDDVSLAFVFTPEAPMQMTNVASVEADEEDPDDSDDVAVATVQVVLPPADLAVTKAATRTAVRVGESFAWYVNVTNQGPTNGTMLLGDELPAGVDLVAFSPEASCEVEGAVVVCEADLGVDETFVLRLDVVANAIGAWTNVAEVLEVDDRDPDLSDNVANSTVVVSSRVVDLAIAKSDDPDPVEVGGDVTYTLVVTNDGPDDATGVVVVDTLPANATFVDADAGCAESAGVVTCRVGDLGVGETAELTIRVTADALGAFVNVANVTSLEPEATPHDNVDEEATRVVPGDGGGDPGAPQGLTCTAEGDDIRLTWTPVAGADRYRVYRDAGEGFQRLASTRNATYLDEAVANGEDYAYRVTALDGTAESGPSATCQATAIPVFPTLLIVAVAVVGAVGAYVVVKRRG